MLAYAVVEPSSLLDPEPDVAGCELDRSSGCVGMRPGFWPMQGAFAEAGQRCSRTKAGLFGRVSFSL